MGSRWGAPSAYCSGHVRARSGTHDLRDPQLSFRTQSHDRVQGLGPRQRTALHPCQGRPGGVLDQHRRTASRSPAKPWTSWDQRRSRGSSAGPTSRPVTQRWPRSSPRRSGTRSPRETRDSSTITGSRPSSQRSSDGPLAGSARTLRRSSRSAGRDADLDAAACGVAGPVAAFVSERVEANAPVAGPFGPQGPGGIR